MSKRIVGRLLATLLLILFYGSAQAEPPSTEPAMAADRGAELSRAATLDQQSVQLFNQGRYDEAAAAAQQALAIREKVYAPDDPALAPSLNNLATVYVVQGRYAEAETLLKRVLAIRQKGLPPDDPRIALSLNNLAELYRLQGRYHEAEPLYERCLAIDEKAPESADFALDLNNLAELYLEQGRYAKAEPLFKRALAIREKALRPDDPGVALSLNNLAGVYQEEHRYAEAEPLLKRSLEIRETALGSEHPDVAQSLNNLAGLYSTAGRKTEAEPLYRRSLAIYEKVLGPEHPDVALGLNNLAALYEDLKRYAEAESLYRRSLAIYEHILGPNHPSVVRGLNNLAGLYEKQGRTAEAVEASRRAVAILAKRAAESAGDRGGGATAELHSRRGYFLHDIALVAAAGEPGAADESFRAAQLAGTSSAAQAVAGMAARFAAGSGALAAVVRERQDLAQRWRRLDAALVKAAREPAEKRDLAAEAELRRQFAATAAELDALDARITHDFPDYAELTNPQPIALAEAQALLAPDEALLVYLVDRDQSWLWVLRRDRTALHRLPIGTAALTAEVVALRRRLDPDFNPNAVDPFDAVRAYTLYHAILEPAAPLLAGAHEVGIVPDGPLQSFPFGVLVTAAPAHEPQTAADHRDIAWFARDHALSVLPSVGALRALRRFAAASHASEPFLGIGNPVLEGQPGGERGGGARGSMLFRGAIADVDAVRQLPPLPETAEELRTVAHALGAGDQDLYLGPCASEPLLRRAGLDRYRVIEFATHGLTTGELEGLAEPALVLTPPEAASPDNDGLLTASKVALLKLNADWVVLSACNTAAADGTPDAEGLSGLAKAFFYAGARSLLVSQWSVPSQATVRLVTDAVEELRRNPAIGRAEALRRAEMAMLDPKNPPEFAHPLVWAPFVLAGEGAAGR